ncbi:MAG: DUF222 domain-containing protein [Xanthomonadales bacterium]|nr:DUF222 domain-containing protein [Xanthomonadales bacterium]
MSRATPLTSKTSGPVRPKSLDHLADEITELSAHLDAGNYRLLQLIEAFDARQGWEGVGMRSCAHWLNWQCGINLGAAREKVRVAKALPALPRISEAFRTGEVSYSKVRAMTRVATPRNEHALLAVARAGTARHVEQQVRWYRKVKRIEALEQENVRHAQRELSCYQDDDGFWVVRGRLTPEQGAIFSKALEAAMDQLFEEQKDVSAETPEDMGAPVSDPVAARRADALVRISEASMSGKGKCGNSGERFMVNIHAEAEVLRHDGCGAEAEVEGHGNVSAETSRRLSCDCSVTHWQEDKQGNPLNIGRKSRTIPPAIRRALKHRDRGCRFPGCTCKHFVDAHHIRHWADGGETSVDNLVLLCRAHHRLVHEGGFGVEMKRGQQVQFTNPRGETLPPAAETRFRGNVFAIHAVNQKSGLGITPKTPVPSWLGEKMDPDMAVDALLACE